MHVWVSREKVKQVELAGTNMNTVATRSNRELSDIANSVRYHALKMIYNSGAGHPGGSLSVTDILVYLYFRVLNVRADDPLWNRRDRLILSKGHATAALYSTLFHRGYLREEQLSRYGEVGSPLQCHPDMRKTPGVDFSTGSLGQGISVAAGMLLGARMLRESFYVYTILGDGEMQEGQVWEALRFAAEYSLSHLIAFIDYNGFQQSRSTHSVMPIQQLSEQISSFGWQVTLVDGHNYEELEAATVKAQRSRDKPSCIIARTVKGKGVSFMENDLSWHVRQPSADEIAQAKTELLSV